MLCELSQEVSVKPLDFGFSHEMSRVLESLERLRIERIH